MILFWKNKNFNDNLSEKNDTIYKFTNKITLIAIGNLSYEKVCEFECQMFVLTTVILLSILPDVLKHELLLNNTISLLLC